MKLRILFFALLSVAMVMPNVSQGCNSRPGIENIDHHFNAVTAIGEVNMVNISAPFSVKVVNIGPLEYQWETLAPTFVFSHPAYYFDKGNTQYTPFICGLLDGYLADKANPPNS